MSTIENYEKIAGNLKIENRPFIDGKYVDPIDGQSFEKINPANGEIITSVAKCNDKDVQKAVECARKSFNSGVWSKCSPEERKDSLLKLAELIRKNSEEMSVLESLDSGKTITDCLNEVGGEVPNFFQWYGELIDKTFGKVVPTGQDVSSFIVKEPIGVVGLVVPWNFPLLMAAWKAAPALAAGCSVILKPAEQSPLTAIKLAELTKEAGIPDGVFNVITGFGDTGEAIGRHPDIDAVSFTGSTEVGALFMRYSGESNLKTIGLEMGGKSPFIVLDDADINDDLIENAAMSAYWNGGQNCSANMRQIIHEKVKDDFLHKVLEKTKSLKVGNPLDPTSEMGSMISEDHFNTVNGYIQKGIDEGASLLHGGVATMGSEGSFVYPTLFDNLNESMTISKEEIFGPVTSIFDFNDQDEAIDIANSTKYGLASGVFTADDQKAKWTADRIQAGIIWQNDWFVDGVNLPGGGYKRSGYGRDGGVDGIYSHGQTKRISKRLT